MLTEAPAAAVPTQPQFNHADLYVKLLGGAKAVVSITIVPDTFVSLTRYCLEGAVAEVVYATNARNCTYVPATKVFAGIVQVLANAPSVLVMSVDANVEYVPPSVERVSNCAVLKFPQLTTLGMVVPLIILGPPILV